MNTRSGRWNARLLALALVVVTPASAMAHALLTSPPPRNERDDLKPPANPGPCGNVPRTTTFVQYEPGATIDVEFKETIDHTGCFQIAFSESGDQDFKVLAQMVDTGGTAGMTFSMKVKLPDGVTCEACTLQLRQQMSGTPACPEDPDEPPIESTYYSCADIRVGDFPDAAPPSSDGDADAGTSEADDGAPESPSGSGGRRISRSEPEQGGCTMGAGAPGGGSLFAAAGLAAAALARWRLRRRP